MRTISRDERPTTNERTLRPRRGRLSLHEHCVLLFAGDGGLRDLIESCDDASVGFVAALRDDEVGELGGDVDVGCFERTAGDAAESAAGGCTDGGLTGGKGWGEIVVAVAGEALLVGEAGERDLSDSCGCTVAKGPGNGAIGTDAEILQGAAGGAILLDGGGAARGSRLRDESRAGCPEQVPGEGKWIGAIGENGCGGGDGRNRDGGVGRRGGAASRGDTFERSIAVENESAGGKGDGDVGAGDVGGRKGNGIVPGVDDGGDGGDSGDAVNAVRCRLRRPTKGSPYSNSLQRQGWLRQSLP